MPRKSNESEHYYFQSETGCILEQRTIILADEVDTELFNKFVFALRYLDAKPDPIKIILCTDGGDIGYSYAIYDMIRTAKSDITTIGTGIVASAGVIILMAGDTRLVTESCVLMSHQGRTTMFDEKFSDIEDRMNYMKWTEERWGELMARHTPHTKAYWINKTKTTSEHWVLGGKAIVKARLADDIAEEGSW